MEKTINETNGMLRVESELLAGLYLLNPLGDDSNVSVYNSADTNDLTTYKKAKVERYVQVNKGQFIEINNCEILHFNKRI